MADQGCSEDSCAQPEKALFGSLNDIKNVIAIMSGKGGVGKSTVTSVLATELNRMGYKVGILDADITGPSIPKAFGIKGGGLQATDFGITPPTSAAGVKVMSVNLFLPNEDDPVIWRGPMLGGVINQFWAETNWHELDYLLIDLPPGTGDVPLTVMQTLPISGIVIVTSPQELVLMIVKKAVKMANKLQTPILGIVENMSHAVCPHCHEKMELFGSAATSEVAANLGVPYLGDIPWNIELNRLMDKGKVDEYQDEATADIAKTVAQVLEKKN
ncbi:MAG: Mrp/NBP35 family ATP-binding protein [Acidobacteriota bacterium]